MRTEADLGTISEVPTLQYHDNEEEYFFKLNCELIEEKRKELGHRRILQEVQERKSLHWMKMPEVWESDGGSRFTGITSDQCKHCHGMYFDHSEFEVLTKNKGRQGFSTYPCADQTIGVDPILLVVEQLLHS